MKPFLKPATAAAAAAAAFALTLAGAAWGVGTSRWTHTSEADFNAGERDGVVATNLGDLKLSRSVKSILPQDSRISAVYAMAEGPGGVVYAATGPKGVLLKIEGDAVSDAAVLGDHLNLFSLRVDRAGRLLVGTGGARGEVYRIDAPGAAPRRIFAAEGVQYVWAMHEADDGTLYLATGPHGQLFAVSAADGASRVVFDSDENNLLCMLGEKGSNLLYIGTDPGGLLLRVNAGTGESFVLYDAAESEISALAWDAEGRILAATAQATPEAEAAAAGEAADRAGRPGGDATGVPIPAVPPENPTPPQMPEPPPGEPRPIPKERNFAALFANDDPPPTEGAPAAASEGEAQEVPADAPAAAAVAGGTGAVTPAENGNAVYRIDREGFVAELYRAPLAIFSLLTRPEPGGAILAGAGGGGDAGAQLVQLRPAADERLTLASVDPRQILSLLAAGDGRTYIGCANRGDVLVLTASFAPSGAFTSPVLDAGQISRFGQMRLRGTLPPGAGVRVSTRSGNVGDPAAVGWSAWSPAVDAAQFLPVATPPARFLQYRLEFTPGDAGRSTPVLQEVEVAYQLPNLAPAVSAVRVERGDLSDPDARAKLAIAWDAADPNGDDLRYTVQFRPAGRAEPGEGWITIKDKLDGPTFEWDTRTAADGWYDLRVVASDAAANPLGQGLTAARLSDPVRVDNTPPVIGDVATEAGPRGGFTLRCAVVDQGGTVEKLEFALNGGDQWQLALPSDMIGDSPREAYAIALPADMLAAGANQVALRATDSTGNQGFVTVSLPARPRAEPGGGN